MRAAKRLARYGTLTREYFLIAADAYATFAALTEERKPIAAEHDRLKAIPADDDLALIPIRNNLYDLDAKILRGGIQTIVFAAMCLESGIYDYAAEGMGDRFTRAYLDKIDLKTKWLIIPHLVCGQMMRRDGAAFQALDSLISVRNELVHSKSKSARLDDLNHMQRQIEESNIYREKIMKNVEIAIRAVVLVSLEMQWLDGERLITLPWFSPDFERLTPLPEALDPIIKDCHRIFDKSIQ
jgi:hypothetical protein